MKQINMIKKPELSYRNATGKIDYGMMNDYMFRAILQTHNNVLKGLISALLHMDCKEVRSATILNPIVLGEAVDNKSFILDIEVLMNDDALINFEMQVVNEGDWTDRALAYMCRAFDQLMRGQEYAEARPVIHIGFLDFKLFREHEEFFGIYKMLNVKDGYIFSDKLCLGVVDLTCIEKATEEDKAYEIDRWASLFRATTWEELRMIAEKNEFMQEASQAMYELSADYVIRQQCLAREEYAKKERRRNRDEEALKQALAEQKKENTELKETNAELEVANAEQQRMIETLLKEIAQLKEGSELK